MAKKPILQVDIYRQNYIFAVALCSMCVIVAIAGFMLAMSQDSFTVVGAIAIGVIFLALRTFNKGARWLEERRRDYVCEKRFPSGW